MALLRLGAKGIDVRRLQMLLNSTLVPPPMLREDGDFGRRTEDAVKRFQQLRRLRPDGLVGPDTWAALGQRDGTGQGLAAAPAGAPWMAIAQAELSVHENAMPGRHNQRIIEYHRTTTLKATQDETPWCSSFVNWVMTRAGHRGTNSALARSWLEWGRVLERPQVGAVTVIKRKQAGSDAATGSRTGFHVALWVSGTPAGIRLLGGNQADSVRYSDYLLQNYDVRSYRWPL